MEKQKIKTIINSFYLWPPYTVGEFIPGTDNIIDSIEEVYENLYSMNSTIVDLKRMTQKYYVGYDRDKKILFRFVGHATNVIYE
jgi:hypothetical protein